MKRYNITVGAKNTSAAQSSAVGIAAASMARLWPVKAMKSGARNVTAPGQSFASAHACRRIGKDASPRWMATCASASATHRPS
jgi:hypothetical protein